MTRKTVGGGGGGVFVRFDQFSLPGVRVSVQTNLCFEVRFVVVVCVCVWGGGGGGGGGLIAVIGRRMCKFVNYNSNRNSLLSRAIRSWKSEYGV